MRKEMKKTFENECKIEREKKNERMKKREKEIQFAHL